MSQEVFEQKRGQHRTRITFDEKAVMAYREDQHHAATFEVEYEELPFESHAHTEKMQPARAAAIFMLGYAVLGTASNLLGGGVLALPPGTALFQVLLAGLFEFAYRKSRVSFTIMDTIRGSLFVIDDDQKDGIIEKLEKRRDAQILERHGAVDLLNHPEHERQRFGYLLEKGVIDRLRYEQALAEIEDGDVAALPSPTTMPPSGTVH